MPRFFNNDAATFTGRRMDPDRDVDDVVRLFERQFQKEASSQLWQWKYRPPWATEPYAWVGEVDGRIVGHIGAVPLRGTVEGADTHFFLFGDSMLDAEFRSMPVYRRFSLINGAEDIRADHPRAVLYGFAGKQVLLWTNWLSSNQSSSFVERADDRIVRLAADDESARRDHPFDVRPWAWDAPQLDELWQKNRASVRFGLIRDRAYLEWRYANHPLFKYSLFGVFQGDTAVGWLVTTLRDQSASWEPEVRVQDMLMSPRIRVPVLRRAARVLRARSLVLWLPDNAVTSDYESRITGWHANHASLSSDYPPEFIRSNLFYSLGEADEWWW